MKRYAILAAATAAATLAAIGVGSATSASSSRTVTIRFTEHTTAQNVVDNPPASTQSAPFSTGDIVTVTNRLETNGKTIGKSRGTCTAIDVPNFVCSGIFVVKGGTVSVLGTYNVASKGVQPLAITGGTGAYRDARGTLTEQAISDTLTRDVLSIDT